MGDVQLATPTQGKYGPGARGDLKPKTAVPSLVSTHTGEVRSRVIPNVTGALRDALTEAVDTPSSTLHTDKWGGYGEVGKKFAGGHESVDRWRVMSVVRLAPIPQRTTFSQLKRSLDGTHHHVGDVHLSRYLAEFGFRYSTRKSSDTARTERLMRQVAGRRSSYRPSIGE